MGKHAFTPDKWQRQEKRNKENDIQREQLAGEQRAFEHIGLGHIRFFAFDLWAIKKKSITHAQRIVVDFGEPLSIDAIRSGLQRGFGNEVVAKEEEKT